VGGGGGGGGGGSNKLGWEFSRTKWEVFDGTKFNRI